MKATELKGKTKSELETSLSQLRRDQFGLKLVKARGELVHTHKIREIRRHIARHMTFLTMQEGKV